LTAEAVKFCLHPLAQKKKKSRTVGRREAMVATETEEAPRLRTRRTRTKNGVAASKAATDT
jgi:hypothetical protein